MGVLHDPPGFHIESSSRKLWRYIQLPQLLRILQEEQLHFSSPASFPDPFEGTLPKAWYEYQSERHRALEESLGQDEGEISELSETRREIVRSNLFVNCWHGNNSESAAMWSRYFNREFTIAITSTANDLKESLADQEEYSIAVGEIEYVNFDLGLDEISDADLNSINRVHAEDDDELGLVLLKRKEFEYESEVRAVVVDHVLRTTLLERDLEVAEDVEPPVDVKVDLGDLINEIRLGPAADNWFVETVENMVENSNTDLGKNDVIESDLDTDPIK